MRKRNKQIILRLTDDELKKLDDMVSKTIFSREQFIRNILAGYKLKEAPLWETVCLLRKAVGNISNIESHSFFREVSDINLLKSSLKDIESCLDELHGACMPIC